MNGWLPLINFSSQRLNTHVFHHSSTNKCSKYRIFLLFPENIDTSNSGPAMAKPTCRGNPGRCAATRIPHAFGALKNKLRQDFVRDTLEINVVNSE
jgi:hypothetical protein